MRIGDIWGITSIQSSAAGYTARMECASIPSEKSSGSMKKKNRIKLPCKRIEAVSWDVFGGPGSKYATMRIETKPMKLEDAEALLQTVSRWNRGN